MSLIKHHASWIIAGLLGFYAILSLLVSLQESAIYDERAHIPAAYSSVSAGDMRINPEHPPLIKDLAGLPLLFLSVQFPFNTPEWQTGVNEQWALGDIFLNCTSPDIVCNNNKAILLWSRIPITLIALLLGWFLFKWGRELGGTLAGIIATGLFVFDPNIIAHGHYVTTDIGIAAFIFFAFYFFSHFLKRPHWKNIALAGLFLGLAELSKFSAILLFPVFGLFTLVFALTKQQPSFEKQLNYFRLRITTEYLSKYALILIICFITITLFYIANTWNMPPEKTIDVARYMFNPNTGVGDTAAKRFALSTITALAPLPGLSAITHYLLGVFMVFSRVGGGNTFYFLGTIGEKASPLYFPLLFVLKETFLFLLLLLLSLGYTLSRIVKTNRGTPKISLFRLFSHSFQERIVQYLALFFILFYATISITGNLNIGFRHLFPILPFLYLLIGKTLADFYKRNEHEIGYILRPFGGILFAITVVTALSAYPHYLSYYNALGGGHTNGYMIATDSNYDWGQDLVHLRNFIDTHNTCVDTPSPECDPTLTSLPRINNLHLDYFGGSNPALYLNTPYDNWYAARSPESGWYAISAVFFQEGLYKSKAPGQQGYEWLNAIGQVGRAGDSIFMFYVAPLNIPSF